MKCKLNANLHKGKVKNQKCGLGLPPKAKAWDAGSPRAFPRSSQGPTPRKGGKSDLPNGVGFSGPLSLGPKKMEEGAPGCLGETF